MINKCRNIYAFSSQLYATGYGAGGRLGVGGTESVSTPTLLESIQHVFIKKVAVNSGGKHCLALSSEGEVYSWGEAEDGKLGHGNRRYMWKYHFQYVFFGLFSWWCHVLIFAFWNPWNNLLKLDGVNDLFVRNRSTGHSTWAYLCASCIGGKH